MRIALSRYLTKTYASLFVCAKSPNLLIALLQVLLDCRTLDEIANCIVDARHQANKAILGFPWPASEVPDLAQRLDHRLVERGQPKIRRFECDYKSGLVYLDIMGESEFHYQVQAGLRGRYQERDRDT